ncbi:MAG TPA: hypothetical protein ENK31_02400, partial [Nannocystis exedens]|nr:hypothetical protein [Nannocystis exedens]
MNVRGTVRAASSVVSAILLFAPLNWPKTAFAAPASQWGDDVGTAEAGEKEEKEEKEEKTPAPPVKPEAEGSGLNAESASKTETKGSKLQTKKIEKKKKKKKKKKRSRSGGAKSQQSKGVLEDEQAAFESATLAGEGALESRFAAEKAAKEKVDAGQDLEAAAELMAAADLGADPALMVSAAETAVAVLNTNRNKRSSQAKGALTAEQRSRAREAATRYASRAQGRLSELEGDHDEFAWLRLGLDRTDLEGLRSRAAAVLAAATQDSAVATPSVSVPVRAPVA